MTQHLERKQNLTSLASAEMLVTYSHSRNSGLANGKYYWFNLINFISQDAKQIYLLNEIGITEYCRKIPSRVTDRRLFVFLKSNLRRTVQDKPEKL